MEETPTFDRRERFRRENDKNLILIIVAIVTVGLTIAGFCASGLTSFQGVKNTVDEHERRLTSVEARLTELQTTASETRNDVKWLRERQSK